MAQVSQSKLPCEVIYSIRNWSEAKQCLSRYIGHSFRGQARAEWALQTSLERVAGESGLKGYETETMVKFRRKANSFLQEDSVGRSEIDCLALMQHHGAPTRLLDVTRSPYVAAFFALERAEAVSAVWVFSPLLTIEGIERSGLIQKLHASPLNALYRRNYLDSLYSEKFPGVFEVEPFYLSDRMRAQQGYFLFPGDPDQGFEANVLSCCDTETIRQNIVRVELSVAMRVEALSDLESMNITRETLFPGLDGLAQSLRWQVERDSLRPEY